MNCKPGELAMVVKGGSYIDDQLLGKVVRVVETLPHCGGVCWTYEGPKISVAASDGYTYDVRGIADVVLRPIRPGEGEDEIVQLLGNPQEVAA
ncbi:MAG TPA: hypothetical protein VMA55_14535 [Acidovorax sp.]|nr:hypothetical protein [Acidovorax sp.]